MIQVTHEGWDCRADETPARTHAPIYWPLREIWVDQYYYVTFELYAFTFTYISS